MKSNKYAFDNSYIFFGQFVFTVRLIYYLICFKDI